MLFGSMEGGGGKAHNRRSVRVLNDINGDGDEIDGVRQSRKLTPIKWVTAGY